MEGIYLVVMLFFGSFLMLSFFVGELTEATGEALEGVGNAIEGVLEAFPGVGDVELTGDIQWGSPSVFRSLMVFSTFWGGGGYIALRWFHSSEAVSLIIAFAFGAAGFLISFLMFCLLARFETSAVGVPSAYIGRRGIVVLPIRSGAFGSVTVDGPLGTEVLTARSAGEVHVGESVEIESIEGGIATVKKA